MSPRGRAAAGLLGVLGVGVGFWVTGGTRSKAAETTLQPGWMIGADTVPLAEAVGLCALARGTGAFEGRIVGLASDGDRRVYVVRTQGDPPVEHYVSPRVIRALPCDQVGGEQDRSDRSRTP